MNFLFFYKSMVQQPHPEFFLDVTFSIFNDYYLDALLK